MGYTEIVQPAGEGMLGAFKLEVNSKIARSKTGRNFYNFPKGDFRIMTRGLRHEIGYGVASR